MKFVTQFSKEQKPDVIGNAAPVAVFDSGVGGISVLRKICDLIPHENYWYFGDSAHAPYGSKSTEEVRELACRHIGYMVDSGVKAVVIACNTATSAAAPVLREQYPHIPVIGMEPEIKTPALAGHRRIMVMATPMTLHLEKFTHLFNIYKDKAEFILLPCPGLAGLIEQGKTDCEETRQYLKRLFHGERQNPVDAVVLGCTHYLHIKPLIAEILGSTITFYDGASGAARELKRKLESANLLNSSRDEGEILVQGTGNPEQFLELSKTLFQR